MKVIQFTFDTIPEFLSVNEGKYAAAIVYGYLEKGYESDGLNLLRNHLQEQKWQILRIINCACIDANEEISIDVQRQEFSLWFDRIGLETISKCELDGLEEKIELGIERFRRSFRRSDRFFTFYSNKYNQYANGVSPNEQEFIPVWISDVDAMQWQSDFPEYDLHQVSLGKYYSWLLPELIHKEIMLGYGNSKDKVTLVHPKSIDPFGT